MAAHVPGIAFEVIQAVADGMRALGHDRPLASRGRTVIPGPEADAWFDAAAVAAGEPLLGIRLPPAIPIGALGPVDYALCTSSTLGAGLERVARYYSAITGRVTMELESSATDARLVLRRRPGLAHSRQWMEFSLAMISQRIRQTAGSPGYAPKLRFVHPAAHEIEAYARALEADVSFDAPLDVIELAPALLGAPMRTASAELAELLERRLSAEVHPDDDAWVQTVRREAAALLAEGTVDLAPLAKRLRVSPRTLQRELLRHGTSHRAIVDEVRRARAQALLARGTPIVEVSTALGFSQATAFFRAFRRWTGTTPQRWTPNQD